MTRLHADPVEVHRTDTGAGLEPEQFLWRGRLYVVRDVLARWTEAGQWWRGDAVRALTSGEAVAATAEPDPLETAPIPPSPLMPARRGAQRAWGEPAPDVGAAVRSGVSPLGGVDDRERSWWRVEAGRGAVHAAEHGTGVYDLCLAEASGTWTLTRVLD
ncbi:MAG TPA: DUF6504 family protein [Mycobacteriales bacterium]|nr:DUF6504 family protein [Mycobacteriales bacterium]